MWNAASLTISKQIKQKAQLVFKRHLEIKVMSERALGKGTECPPLVPGTLRLYSMRFCPYAQRTRLVLDHKNITYETVNVNLKSKPDWFWARNPIGLVPILEKDGKIVYESTVCNDYLDHIYPEPRLIPSDIYQASRDRMLWETFGKVTELFYDIPKSKTDGTYERCLKRYFRQMQRYEDELSKRGSYFGGSSPCMVDFMLWPWFERIGVITVVAPEAEITKGRYPSLHAWMELMMQLPAVKASYEEPNSHIHFFASLRNGNPDYDYGLP